MNTPLNPESRLRALVLYFSPGGNTRLVAEACARGLESQGLQVTIKSLPEGESEDLYGYDLVCLGAPSYNFAVPEPVLRYIKRQLGEQGRQGRVHLNASPLPGKTGVALVTYAGPHTGIDEAIPAGEQLAQFLAHLGLRVRGMWYTVGQYHDEGRPELNLYGCLGDIRGRPNKHDLGVIESNAAGLAFVLRHEAGQATGQG